MWRVYDSLFDFDKSLLQWKICYSLDLTSDTPISLISLFKICFIYKY